MRGSTSKPSISQQEGYIDRLVVVGLAVEHCRRSIVQKTAFCCIESTRKSSISQQEGYIDRLAVEHCRRSMVQKVAFCFDVALNRLLLPEIFAHELQRHAQFGKIL